MSGPDKIDIAASHRQAIGCSKIAQALGISRFGSQFQLWEQYTNRKAPWPDIGNQLRVALGEPMEEVLQPFVEMRLGRHLRRDRKEYRHDSLPLVGHVDYRASVLDSREKRPVVDMKTSLGWGAKSRFGDDGTDEVDDDVLCQMQGYLMLTGADTAYVAALVPGPELKIYTIQRDDDLIALISERIADFWHHVQTDTPPPPATLDDAARRWPDSNGNAVTADGDALSALAELRELKAQIQDLQQAHDVCELAIKAALGDAETLLGPDGKALCTWKSGQSTRLDTAAIKAAGLYDQYAKTTTSRVFRLKGAK
jgi:predicted phage-related endonuclease